MIVRAVRASSNVRFARRRLTCIVRRGGWTCLAVGSIHAQTVVGRVISASDSTPIAGAIIQLQAEKGGWLSVALTTRDGMFSTRALSLGPYNVRVVRIGYKPFAAGMLSVQGETSTTILWKSVAVSLPTQLTRSKAVCDISAELMMHWAKWCANNGWCRSARFRCTHISVCPQTRSRRMAMFVTIRRVCFFTHQMRTRWCRNHSPPHTASPSATAMARTRIMSA